MVWVLNMANKNDTIYFYPTDTDSSEPERFTWDWFLKPDSYPIQQKSKESQQTTLRKNSKPDHSFPTNHESSLNNYGYYRNDWHERNIFSKPPKPYYSHSKQMEYHTTGANYGQYSQKDSHCTPCPPLSSNHSMAYSAPVVLPSISPFRSPKIKKSTPTSEVRYPHKDNHFKPSSKSVTVTPNETRKSGKTKRKRRLCKEPNCQNQVVQGGLCIRHGAKRKICSVEGCNKHVKMNGRCSTHNRGINDAGNKLTTPKAFKNPVVHV